MKDRQMKYFRRTKGFTLLEILVSLGIISLTLLMLTLVESQSNKNADGLRERTLAHWVAMNKLTEMRLSPNWPAMGSSNGEVELAKINWRWSAEVSNTEDPDLRRIEVSVSQVTAPDDRVVKLIGFRGNPQARPLPVSPPPVPGQ